MESFSAHVAAKGKTYADALAAGGYEHLLVSAGGLVYGFHDDLDYPFRCSAYFGEWSPIQDRPDSYLLVSPGEKPRLFISAEEGYWDSPPAPVPDWVAAEFEVVAYRESADLKRLIGERQHLAWLGPQDELTSAVNPSAVNPQAVINHIDYHRAYKTAYEIACMEKASRLAGLGHAAAAAAFAEGKSELDIHLAYLEAMPCADQDLPYRSIIALNRHASVLHHMALQRNKPAEHLSFLIDAGAQHHGYASDVSRTHVTQDERGLSFRKLRDDLDVLQQALVASVAAGNSFTELHEDAHQRLAELLVNHELVNCSVEQALSRGLTSVFFPHGLGHLLGIQVHDRGGHMRSPDGEVQEPPAAYPHLRFTRTLEESMVFTIEPGLYFIEALLEGYREQSLLNHQRIDELKPFGGIRIEDNVLVTESGVRNLTREAFTPSP